jgi:hypothetical protein
MAGRGHDYRAGLARMVSEAHRPPVTDELLALAHALQGREAEWARRRLIAERLRRPGGGPTSGQHLGFDGDTTEAGSGPA